MNTSSTHRAGLALAVGAAVAACLHAWFGYKGFAADGAFVAFRYAERLASGLGPTWTGGLPTEGYPSAAWVLGLAVADPVGLEPIRAARLASYGFTAAAVLAACVDPASLRPTAGRALTGGALLAASGSLAAWTMGGHELAALAGAVGVALIAAIRLAEADSAGARAATGAALLAVILLRSDAYPLALGILTGGSLATRSIRPWAAAGALPLLALGLHTAIRAWVYGTWLPPQIPDDLGPLLAAVGLRWTLEALLAHGILVAAAASALTGSSARSIVPFLAAIAWPVHLVAIGGGSELGWAALVPVLPALALLASEGLGTRIDTGDWRALAAAVIAIPLHAALVSSTGDLDRARAQHSEWYAPPIAHVLVGAFGERSPLLAVEEPGVLPYWTGFEAVDLRAGDPGERRPDLIALADPSQRSGSTRAGRALLLGPDFREYHQLVTFTARSKLVGRQKASFWVRREGGALGIARKPDELRIPGWFLASPGSWAARWDGAVLAAPVTADRVSEVPALLLRAGTWEVSSEAGPIRFDWRCEGVSATRVAGRSSAVVRLDEPGHVDLLAWAEGEGVPVQELVVRRSEAEPGRLCGDEIPAIPWSELPREVPDGSDWDAPGAVTMGEAGASLVLDEPSPADGVVLSLDANDAYKVLWMREGVAVGRSKVLPADGSGLVARELPTPAAARPFDALRIVPVAGDGTWSVGAARLSGAR